jgi:dihydropteroate synthase
MSSINCKGKILNLSEPVIMGIINATPDSFYEGHLKYGKGDIVKMAGKMISEGAAILDVGGQSTRPGSQPITIEEELNRVIPVIESVHSKYSGTIISIDTYKQSFVAASLQFCKASTQSHHLVRDIGVDL